MKKSNVIKIAQLFYLLILLPLLFSCDKDESAESFRFEIDCEQSSIEGSFVQNTQLSALSVFNLYYSGGNVSAKISAKETNGVFVSEKQVELSENGILKIQIEGKPIDIGEFTLKVEVEINNNKYYCSQIFEVFEDTDPNAPITFSVDEKYNEIIGLTDVLEIPFNVDPPMASIIITEQVEGLNVTHTIDKKTGAGILTLTPSDNFISGELTLSISFGARQTITHKIKAFSFAKGDGVNTPYEINSLELLKKIHLLLDKKFILTTDIDMNGSAWQPVGSEEKAFTGVLNGNGKTISNINLNGTVNVALFGFTGKTAQISNLKISGKATGTEYVAGLVSVNAGTITNCNATDMVITGENYLSGLVSKNSGSINSSTPLDVLDFTGFPAMISEIITTIDKPLNYSPSTAEATIIKMPENATAAIIGGILRITPQAGFVKSEMSVKVSLGNVSSVEKTILLFAEEQFDDGDGSTGNPYKISKVTQFSKIRDYADKSFIMTADIDLSLLGEEWIPIPSFSGTLDGGNYQVKNLKFESAPAKGGLIISNSGNIKNLSFPDVNIKTAASFGTIVGEHSSGKIENIVLKGILSSSHTGDLLGGVAAEIFSGEISNVYVNLTMDATCGMVGGIAGRARTGASIISNCTAEGSITINAGKSRIAGLVGRGESAVVIKNCLSAVNITATVNGANGVGGIFGANNNDGMQIEECKFTGKITNVFMCGGIAGVAANVRNCLVEGTGTSSTMINVGGGTINTSSTGGICGTAKVILEKSIVRNAAFAGTTMTTLPISGIVSTFQSGGYVTKCVADNVNLNGTTIHGIAGTAANGTTPHADNYTSEVTYVGYTPENDSAGLDGGIKTGSELTQAFYQSLGYDFASVWMWSNGKPELRNVGYKGSMSTSLLRSR